MVRRITIYLLISILVLSFELNAFAQSKGKKSKDLRSQSKIGLQLTIEEIAETTAEIKYEADSANYAIFISTLESCEKTLPWTGNFALKDTAIYPILKNYPKVGKLVASGLSAKKGKIFFVELASRNDYWIHIFKKQGDSLIYYKSFQFNTIAKKPELQAYQIAFDDVTDTSFVVSWVNGSGEGRILVVAKGEKFDKPENGKEYKASNALGKGDLIKGTTSVVYDGKDLRPKIKVTGLEPGTKYAVGVFEYNGNGKYRHYNIASESNNPRVKATRIPAPIILNATPLEEGVYQIKWKKSKGAITYLLDLARDREFKQIVEPYKDLDIGDLESYEISDLERNAKYYIRLKAKGEFGESLYSPVFELKTK